MNEISHSTLWTVVANPENRLSLWRQDMDVPGGWRVIGVTGSREDCLSWIDTNWTDLRPESLRASNATSNVPSCRQDEQAGA